MKSTVVTRKALRYFVRSGVNWRHRSERLRDPLGGPCSHRHDRQLRIDPDGARHGASVHDKEAWKVVSLMVDVHDARTGIPTHLARAERVVAEPRDVPRRQVRVAECPERGR